MATHYSKNNALKEEYLTAKRKATLGAKVCGICFILWAANIFMFHISNPPFLFPCFMGFAGGGVYMALHSQKSDKLKSGVEGEESTVDFLTSLPESYNIVSNAIKYSPDGKRIKTIKKAKKPITANNAPLSIRPMKLS